MTVVMGHDRLLSLWFCLDPFKHDEMLPQTTYHVFGNKPAAQAEDADPSPLKLQQ